ncbi:YaaR family protein [Haloimpatiens lingqiaonensis]|uniref:YaaR family protein n=1 Tax=Haloimpatiens lingqiaonensis TaxID=1380675 RepID=UPI0010FDFD92|nr:YaaR family protein [Haloimpatiens lingqiaonensis]
MEINRVGRNVGISQEKHEIKSKKDFSQNFNFARQQKSQKEMKELLDNIKKKGNRLAITKSYRDVKAYKNLIKEYLQSVLSHMYKVEKDISFWQTQYFITVETVDMKLEEITNAILNEQIENLNIASTIDEITGLVVDLYK